MFKAVWYHFQLSSSPYVKWYFYPVVSAASVLLRLYPGWYLWHSLTMTKPTHSSLNACLSVSLSLSVPLWYIWSSSSSVMRENVKGEFHLFWSGIEGRLSMCHCQTLGNTYTPGASRTVLECTYSSLFWFWCLTRSWLRYSKDYSSDHWWPSQV